ncbi:hypothetical protein HPP92_025115 [Vanilla planifolia]|uniref:Uncharacterized protein n=1 Tax=Vanilla planifolia TaxID=51239 RepID=A0A835PKC6_VANPL|nr:hypothetical protein HPP92_025115 [Vanilla planifolia]
MAHARATPKAEGNDAALEVYRRHGEDLRVLGFFLPKGVVPPSAPGGEKGDSTKEEVNELLKQGIENNVMGTLRD